METAGPQCVKNDAHRSQKGAGEVCQGYEDEGRSVHLGVGLRRQLCLVPSCRDGLAVCLPEILQVSGVLGGVLAFLSVLLLQDLVCFQAFTVI